MTTQRDELLGLIKWLAKRTRNWNRLYKKYDRDFHLDMSEETMGILRHTIAIYLPVKHYGMQKFICCSFRGETYGRNHE